MQTPKRLQLFGIEVRVHWTFSLLLGWLFATELLAGHGYARAFAGALFTVTVFACVVLHELGHALMARRFGIQTRSITLYPIGGVAQLARLPERPREELLVAIMGPLVSFAIAGVLLLFVTLPPTVEVPTLVGNFWGNIAYVNLSLGLFNLLPALPMDGGRVLHAALAWRIGTARATSIASEIGKVIALLMGAVGITAGQFMLVLIAGFVFVSAQREALVMRTRSVLQGVTVRDAMLRRFAWLDAAATVAEAANALRDFDQDGVPVLRQGELVGVITRFELVRELEAGHDTTSITTLVHPTQAVTESTPLEDALEPLQNAEAACLPVMRDGALLGLLTAEHLGKWLSLRGAVGARDQSAQTAA